MPHSNTSPVARRWLTQSLLSPLPTPLTLDWLFDDGSLTRRLTRLSDNGFSVTPLVEAGSRCGTTNVPPWTYRRPALAGYARCICAVMARPGSFARSVAARSALQGDGLHMDELGSRSLGELLFCDQAFTRRPIEVCRYPGMAANGRTSR